MAAGRWSVFRGMLNNHAGFREEGEGRPLFCLIPRLQSAISFFFFPPAVCLVVGRGFSGRVLGVGGCEGDYEFCQAEQG